MQWLPYLEQKPFSDWSSNLCLLTAQRQDYEAHGTQETFTKLALTSRCGISLVILTDELKHTSLLKTKEQMGSMQAGICELDWPEVKPYSSSQKSHVEEDKNVRSHHGLLVTALLEGAWDFYHLGNDGIPGPTPGKYFQKIKTFHSNRWLVLWVLCQAYQQWGLF